MPPRKKTVQNFFQVRGPFIGIDTQRESRLLSSKEAEDALNVVLDNGTIKVRKGYDAGATATNNATIEGQHDYRQADGTRIHLVKAGNQLYKLSGSSFTAIGSPGDLITGNYAQFITVNNRVYISHGGVPRVTDGTTLETWLITRPDVSTAGTAVALAPTGDELSGKYDYKFTFYSSTWGQESTASDATSKIVAKSRNVDITNIPTSSDSRVDKVRIYRRKTSARETEWFRIAEVLEGNEVGGSTSYTDSNSDSDASITKIAPLSFEGSFPNGAYIANNAGTFFMAGVANEPNKLYYSAVESTALEDFLFIEDEGSGITGLLSFQSQLVIFTTRSIWILSGNRRSNFFLRKAIPDRGCVAPFSIVPVDNQIYFLSENGFYSYDLSRVREISRSIQPTILDRNYSKDPIIVGMHDIQENAVRWLYASTGSSTLDKMLVYYYRNSAVVGRDSWVPWNIPNLSHMAQITDPTTELREVRLGFSDGRIATETGNSDNGVAPTWLWQTSKNDAGIPYIKKHWGELTVETVEKTSGSMDVSSAVDTETAFTLSKKQHSLKRELFRTRLDRRGAQLRLKMNGSSTVGTEVLGWTVQVDPSVKS